MKIRSYLDARHQWRWSAVDGNGRIIADGSEGYATEDSLRRALVNVMGEFRKEILFERTSASHLNERAADEILKAAPLREEAQMPDV